MEQILVQHLTIWLHGIDLSKSLPNLDLGKDFMLRMMNRKQ